MTPTQIENYRLHAYLLKALGPACYINTLNIMVLTYIENHHSHAYL